jgi:hypothetical protein
VSRIFQERYILCVGCGYDGTHTVLVKEIDGAPAHDTVTCPKCSKMAYNLHPFRLRLILSALTKELVELKKKIGKDC